MLVVALAGCAAQPVKPGSDDELSSSELEVHGDTAADGHGPYQGNLDWCDTLERDLDDRLAYHLWSFELEAGCDDMFLDLASRDGGDTYLILYRWERRRWVRIAANDDCRGSLNSCLQMALEPGAYLALAPDLARDILAVLKRECRKELGEAIVLTQADIRRFVRRLVEAELPHVVVLSFQELAPTAQVQPLGRIGL